jgi:hypothetical protein
MTGSVAQAPEAARKSQHREQHRGSDERSQRHQWQRAKFWDCDANKRE